VGGKKGLEETLIKATIPVGPNGLSNKGSLITSLPFSNPRQKCTKTEESIRTTFFNDGNLDTIGERKGRNSRRHA